MFAPGAGAGGPSGLLLDVLVPERVVSDDDGIGRGEGSSIVVEVDVPLHARYGVPKTGGDLTDEVALPPPEAFWACPSSGRDDTEGSHNFYFIFFSLRLSFPFLMYSKMHAQSTRCATQSRRARTWAHYQRWRREDARLDSACRVGSHADAPRACWRCGRRGICRDRHGCGGPARVCVSPSDDCERSHSACGCTRKRGQKKQLKLGHVPMDARISLMVTYIDPRMIIIVHHESAAYQYCTSRALLSVE